MKDDNGDDTQSNETPAEKAKRLGMEQVEENANAVWIEFMLDLIWEVCLIRRQFTTDDVFDRYDDYAGMKPTTHEKRAMGPVMLKAAKMGFCKKAYLPGIPSRRTSLHASPIQVWDSLIFEGE